MIKHVYGNTGIWDKASYIIPSMINVNVSEEKYTKEIL